VAGIAVGLTDLHTTLNGSGGVIDAFVSSNKIDGAVIVLMDIDELRHALVTTVEMVNQPLLVLDAELCIYSVNHAFVSMFQMKAEEITGKAIFDIAEGQFNHPNLRLLLEDILPKNKRVTDYELEVNFPKLGKRRLKLNAVRFFEEGRGMQNILLALQDVTGKG